MCLNASTFEGKFVLPEEGQIVTCVRDTMLLRWASIAQDRCEYVLHEVRMFEKYPVKTVDNPAHFEKGRLHHH